jgi:hypothetical protein
VGQPDGRAQQQVRVHGKQHPPQEWLYMCLCECVLTFPDQQRLHAPLSVQGPFRHLHVRRVGWGLPPVARAVHLHSHAVG